MNRLKTRILYFLIALTLYNCSSDESDGQNIETSPPNIITKVVSDITETTAVGGSEISSVGNLNITERGVVYNTTGNPNIEGGLKIISSESSNNFNININELEPNTTYFIKSYIITEGSTIYYGNEINFTTAELLTLPTVITLPLTYNKIYKLKAGAEIISDTPIRRKGVYFGTSPNPTEMIDEYWAEGDFELSLGVELSTTYYVKAFAKNSAGIAYGDEVSFTTPDNIYDLGDVITDFDNNSYSTIIVNGQEWMQSNLNVSHFNNGDVIPQVQDEYEWINTTSPAWCYYANETENGIEYGKLYNYYAVTDSRGLAPNGWRIPSLSDWESLIDFIDDLRGDGHNKYFNAAGFMQEGSSHWNQTNIIPTNISGFTALPGGYRGYASTGNGNVPVRAVFSNLNSFAHFWVSDNIDDLDIYDNNGENLKGLNAYTVSIRSTSPSNTGEIYISNKINGYSVRCIKN